MLGVAMYNTIETLFKRGLNKSEISRLTGHDWKTVSKVIKTLRSGGTPCKQPHPSKLDAYHEKILEWLESGLSGVRIHEKLSSLSCQVSYSTVKLYLRKLQGSQAICIRFHSLPGEEAQVDFGYVGRIPDDSGKVRKAWVFNMRLCYSRLDFYKLVFDQTVETFIQCHMDAFKYFNGIPSVVKIDNLKAAILSANFYQPVYQSLYKQYADYHGFQIVPCRVRKPQEKGKVESGIKYIKNNFFAGRQFKSSQELKLQLIDWLDNKCNARLHGTTRRVPRELFAEKEQSALKSLPKVPFKQVQVGQRKLYKDCHVYIGYNYYSAPFKYVGEVLDIEMDEHIVKLFHEGVQIAAHQRLSGQGQFSTNESHYPDYKLVFSSRNKKCLADKMLNIGANAHKVFTLLLEKQPYHWHQTTRGILSLQKHFDDRVIDLACYRALIYGAIKYQKIKSICESGSYSLPICLEERVH